MSIRRRLLPLDSEIRLDNLYIADNDVAFKPTNIDAESTKLVFQACVSVNHPEEICDHFRLTKNFCISSMILTYCFVGKKK